MSKKSSFLSVILSIIPGMGHMYLGFMDEGIKIMVSFFVAIAATVFLNVLNLSLICGIFIPVIWIYSIFDAYHRNQQGYMESKIIEKIKNSIDISSIKNNKRVISYVFIFIGLYGFVDYFTNDVLRYYFGNSNEYFYFSKMIKTIIVGGLFIYTGFRLLPENENKNKNKKMLLKSSSVSIDDSNNEKAIVDKTDEIVIKEDESEKNVQ